MNGSQVRDTWFCKPGVHAGIGGGPGYDARQVDDLLCRVATELDAGGSAWPLIQDATFRTRKSGRRYDIEAVDRFLDRFLLAPGHFEPGGITDDSWWELPVAQFGEGDSKEYFHSRCEDAWRAFGQAPGTHLWFGKTARGLTELRTADQQTLVSVQGSGWPTFSTGGRSYTLPPASAAESRSPAVAELLARVSRADGGHYTEVTRIQTILTGLLGSPARASAGSPMRQEDPFCITPGAIKTGGLALVSCSLISGGSGF